MIRSSTHASLALIVAVGMNVACAAEAKQGASKNAELTQLDSDSSWKFAPKIGRLDTFYDGEAMMAANNEIAKKTAQADVDPELANKSVDKSADMIAFALQEQVKVENLIAARKYDETIRSADNALKRLERFTDLPEVRKAASRIGAYREQADDALTRNEAQTAFNALGFKIEGILWSEAGQRLVILAGESRAWGINDGVKGCVIINIDTDRVDFRYIHKLKRFEFPLYVGKVPNTAATR